MKKTFVLGLLSVFLLALYLSLRYHPLLSTHLVHLLNQDAIMLNNGNIVRGWIWDDAEGVIVGEDRGGMIFFLLLSECQRSEKDALLKTLSRLW